MVDFQALALQKRGQPLLLDRDLLGFGSTETLQMHHLMRTDLAFASVHSSVAAHLENTVESM